MILREDIKNKFLKAFVYDIVPLLTLTKRCVNAIAWRASYLYALWYNDVAINDDFAEFIDQSS